MSSFRVAVNRWESLHFILSLAIKEKPSLDWVDVEQTAWKLEQRWQLNISYTFVNIAVKLVRANWLCLYFVNWGILSSLYIFYNFTLSYFWAWSISCYNHFPWIGSLTVGHLYKYQYSIFHKSSWSLYSILTIKSMCACSANSPSLAAGKLFSDINEWIYLLSQSDIHRTIEQTTCTVSHSLVITKIINVQNKLCIYSIQKKQ